MPVVKERYGFTEAKDRLSALTARANATGASFVVTKNGKPWVEVRPLAVRSSREGAIAITPVRREVKIPDVGELLDGYDGGFAPQEDGFADAVGTEAV